MSDEPRRPDQAGQAPHPYRVGVIADRHEMPVDEYLAQRVRPGQSAYDEVYAACDDWLRRHPEAGLLDGPPLEFYYSGLTEATLAVADALHNHARTAARLMRYDIVAQDYEPLRRKIEGCSVQDPPSRKRPGV